MLPSLLHRQNTLNVHTTKRQPSLQLGSAIELYIYIYIYIYIMQPHHTTNLLLRWGQISLTPRAHYRHFFLTVGPGLSNGTERCNRDHELTAAAAVAAATARCHAQLATSQLRLQASWVVGTPPRLCVCRCTFQLGSLYGLDNGSSSSSNPVSLPVTILSLTEQNPPNRIQQIKYGMSTSRRFYEEYYTHTHTYTHTHILLLWFCPQPSHRQRPWHPGFA